MNDNEREPETEYSREPDVVEEGDEDAGLVAQAPPLDPYTPEPGPRAGERRAFRMMLLALIPIAVVVVVIIIAAVR